MAGELGAVGHGEAPGMYPVRRQETDNNNCLHELYSSSQSSDKQLVLSFHLVTCPRAAVLVTVDNPADCQYSASGPCSIIVHCMAEEYVSSVCSGAEAEAPPCAIRTLRSSSGAMARARGIEPAWVTEAECFKQLK